MENQISAIARILGVKKGEKNHLSCRKVVKTVERHVWSIADELLAIALYKNKATPAEIAEGISGTKIKLSSMMMKLSNIKYLDIGEGLENVSETTKALWLKS